MDEVCFHTCKQWRNIIGNISVKKGIQYLLFWEPILVYWYENPGYVIVCNQKGQTLTWNIENQTFACQVF